MKRIALQIYCMLFLSLVGFSVLNGQQSNTNQTSEKVVLFSDRTLYIAGERILFSAFLQSGSRPDQDEPSRVLYCEIISPDGNKIAGNKYLINNSLASGYLAIPDDIITGFYYLRAYTKFMRNYGPNNYHYTCIRIVNANRSEVQSVMGNNTLSEILSVEDNPEKKGGSFIISTDKSEYSTRDTVRISIDGTATIPSWKGLNLAVVPEFSITPDKLIFPENSQSEKGVLYYPETRGLSLTGKLTDNRTGNPMPGTRVNLSVIGRGKDFMAVQTDTAGRFFFSLPDYTGSRDLFLCAENTGTSDPKILIDNDYCTVPVHLPSNIFTLTPQEREAAYNMAVNKQLGSYFKIDSIPDSQNQQPEDQAFYGKPNEIFYIDKFVQLPTLEDYFNELINLAKVRKRQGGKYFKVLGTQTGLTDFDPLILVDLVAVDNPALVLAIPPLNISRIEVVNMLYVKGDQTYGGIINIISKRGDFAGIDLPSSGVFINYGFLAGSSHYPGNNPPPQHFPDTRNTLFWEPHLVLNKGNTAKLSFTTADTPGRYLIILIGINLSGELFSKSVSFRVIK